VHWELKRKVTDAVEKINPLPLPLGNLRRSQRNILNRAGKVKIRIDTLNL
jgi:hypothetical protein